MELSIIITVVIIIVFFVFRKPIKRTSESADKLMDYLNDSAATLAVEGKKENTRRILAAMKELEDMGGPVDFDELYNKACGKSAKK